METVREPALKEKETVHGEQEIFHLPAVIEKKDSQIEKLKNELLYIRRILFGRSSERHVRKDPDQLKLDFEGEDSLPEEAHSLLPPDGNIQTAGSNAIPCHGQRLVFSLCQSLGAFTTKAHGHNG